MLRLDSQIGEGWELHKKTYCFSEEIKFDWRFGYTIRAQVNVFPSPSSLQDAFSKFNLSTTENGQRQGVTFNLREGTLILDLNISDANAVFNNDLPWCRTTKGKLCIEWEHFVFPYRLFLLIVFNPPESGPPMIEREWCRRFYPGGLPSLGKRR